jgi:hypothetical protein
MPNLDRFSHSMAWETFPTTYDEPDQIDDDLTECACGCGYFIDFDSPADFVESELYEDVYISNNSTCIKRYYDKEKRAAVVSNS